MFVVLDMQKENVAVDDLRKEKIWINISFPTHQLLIVTKKSSTISVAVETNCYDIVVSLSS